MLKLSLLSNSIRGGNIEFGCACQSFEFVAIEFSLYAKCVVCRIAKSRSQKCTALCAPTLLPQSETWFPNPFPCPHRSGQYSGPLSGWLQVSPALLVRRSSRWSSLCGCWRTVSLTSSFRCCRRMRSSQTTRNGSSSGPMAGTITTATGSTNVPSTISSSSSRSQLAPAQAFASSNSTIPTAHTPLNKLSSGSSTTKATFGAGGKVAAASGPVTSFKWSLNLGLNCITTQQRGE